MILVEQKLSKKLVKYPKDFIIRLRVEEFHRKMSQFIGELLGRLP